MRATANWRPLAAHEIAALSGYIPERDLHAARLCLGAVPWYLPRRFAAVTRGSRIYFRPGSCRPETPAGLALLGHELVHVGQYRRGATWLTFLLSYLRHGYRKSPLEIEARATAQRLLSVTRPSRVRR